MSADDAMYNNLFKQAVNMQYKFNDFTAGTNHGDVHVLQNQIHNLITDVRMRKDPNALNSRIRNIEHQLSTGQHSQQPYMNYAHNTYLRNNYEHMRQNVVGWQPDQQ